MVSAATGEPPRIEEVEVEQGQSRQPDHSEDSDQLHVAQSAESDQNEELNNLLQSLQDKLQSLLKSLGDGEKGGSDESNDTGSSSRSASAVQRNDGQPGNGRLWRDGFRVLIDGYILAYDIVVNVLLGSIACFFFSNVRVRR